MTPEAPRPHAIWDTVLTASQLYCDAQVFDELITPARLDDYDQRRETVVVQIPNTLNKRDFDRDALPALKKAFLNALGVEPRVFVEAVDPKLIPANPKAKDRGVQVPLPLKRPQNPLPKGMNPHYELESYIVGQSNQLAMAAVNSVLDAPGSSYNPLYLHGGVGLGKTHLMQGLCRAMIERRPDLKVRYLTCETFVNDFLDALARNEQSSFRARFRDIDVLLVDDIHFLAGKEKSQEEFFHTFNSLYNAGKQIVVSSDSQPKELPEMEERLVSRFVWGLPARIDPPNEATRQAIINEKARRRGVVLPQDVVEFIAGIATSNVRELEGAVIQVAATASMHGRPVSMTIAREALGHVLSLRSARRTTLEDIVGVVCDEYSVRLSDLQSHRRTRAVTVPRQIAMYLVKELTDKTLEEIGGVFGGRDHSTVLHSVRKVTQQVKNDNDFARRIESMRLALSKVTARAS